MAVFTHISLKEAQNFCAKYPALKTPTTITAIETGTDNSNYKLTSQDGTHYILTIFEGRLDVTHLPPIFDFVALINEKVITAPKPYTDQNGQALNMIQGKTAILVEFIQGHSVNTPTSSQAKKMGALLAKMHKTLETMPLDVPINPLSIQNCRDIYNQCLDWADDFEPDVINTAFDRALAMHHDLPTGAIHGDAFPDNVFFNDDEISGIIDFYFACHDSYIYDMTVALNAWCFDTTGTPINTNLRGFLDGYLAHRTLTENEAIAIDDIGRSAALQIFSTRLRNIKKGTKDTVYNAKNPHPYLNIIKFYNQTGLKDML